MLDHHKYNINEKVWNIARITKMWQTVSKQMLPEKWHQQWHQQTCLTQGYHKPTVCKRCNPLQRAIKQGMSIQNCVLL